jgi:hypothetical protein
MLAHEHAPDTDLLADCSAIVVAHDKRDSAVLLSLAARVGFGSVTTHEERADAHGPLHSLLFFLVHYGIGVTAKKQLLADLRSSPFDAIRFAPVVIFVPDGPYDDVLFHIEMGFDDVICLPENSHVLSSRLAGQVGQDHLFIQTATYLGPDRRRMEMPGQTHPGRTGGFEHTRITIRRTAETGVQVVRRQLFMKTQ